MDCSVFSPFVSFFSNMQTMWFGVIICFSLELECQPPDVFVSMWSYHVLCNPMWDGPFHWYDTKIKNAFSRSFNHS